MCRAVNTHCVQHIWAACSVYKACDRKASISFSKVVRSRAKQQWDSESQQAWHAQLMRSLKLPSQTALMWLSHQSKSWQMRTCLGSTTLEPILVFSYSTRSWTVASAWPPPRPPPSPPLITWQITAGNHWLESAICVSTMSPAANDITGGAAESPGVEVVWQVYTYTHTHTSQWEWLTRFSIRAKLPGPANSWRTRPKTLLHAQFECAPHIIKSAHRSLSCRRINRVRQKHASATQWETVWT